MTKKKNKIDEKPHPRIFIWLLITAIALTVGVFIFAGWVLATLKTELTISEINDQYRQDKILIEMKKKAKAEALTETVGSDEWRKAVMSMYNVGDPYQNSGDPCITANGDNGCELIAAGGNYCASNLLPFGTEILIWIENVGPLGSCIVIDRTGEDYSHRIDWMLPFDGRQGEWIEHARNWGVRRVLFKINEEYDKIDGEYEKQIE